MDVSRNLEEGKGKERHKKETEQGNTMHPEFLQIVQLTETMEKQFTDALWKERDRVSGFFEKHVRLSHEALDDLEQEVQQRREENIQIMGMKKDFFDLLIECEELVDFARLNLVGFTKIVKKFSHTTDFKYRRDTMNEIEQSPFVTMVPDVEQLCERIKQSYMHAFSEAKSGGNNGSGSGGNSKNNDAKLEQEITQSVNAARSWKLNTILFQVDEHMAKTTIREKKQHIKWIPVAAALVLFVLFLFAPILSEGPAQRALAVLIAATILWVSECWPLFVTSILVIIMVPICGVLLDADGEPMSAPDAAKAVFSKIFPTSVPLVLAGFSISIAWKKFGIDLMVAHAVLGNKFFRTPQRFVLAVELLCFVMSMFISNVAASVLTLTVIMPVIRDLPDRCTYIKTLLMAIAVSGNCGGMTTQIASPQNAVSVSVGQYSIDFIKFIAVAIPVCPFLLATGHILVTTIYKPDIKVIPSMNSNARTAIMASSSSSGSAAVALEAARVSSTRGNIVSTPLWKRLPYKQGATIFITVLAVVLWVSSNWLEPLGKNIGIISFIPIMLFFGTGLLTKEDFEGLPWPLVMLLMGGNILGYAVESSQLLQLMAGILEALPPHTFVLSLVSCLMMMIAGSFVSHTVAALILLSLSAKVGESVGHPELMIMTSIIMCSGAMPLPMSSFPNLNAISLEDANGVPYLKTLDFIMVGVPQTLIAFVFSNSITYGMSLAVGY